MLAGGPRRAHPRPAEGPRGRARAPPRAIGRRRGACGQPGRDGLPTARLPRAHLGPRRASCRRANKGGGGRPGGGPAPDAQAPPRSPPPSPLRQPKARPGSRGGAEAFKETPRWSGSASSLGPGEVSWGLRRDTAPRADHTGASTPAPQTLGLGGRLPPPPAHKCGSRAQGGELPRSRRS